MRRVLRLLPLVLLATLVSAASASAAIIGAPEFTAPAFTKAQAGVGNAVLLTVNYLPPQFSNAQPGSHIDTVATDAESPGAVLSASGGTTSTSNALFVTNGHLYNLTVAACESAALCTTVLNTAGTGQTRVDATPPAGTVQINDGAVATNKREVTLNLSATDPLINGIPGSSSGITEYAVDPDGDGSYPCSPLFLDPTVDRSGCPRAFAPTGPATLTANDGPKTVGVRYGDGARQITAQCPTQFCAFFPPTDLSGNGSAPATDTIILDTVKPLAVASQDRFVVDRGGAVSFDAGSSTDPNGANGSGVDPAATTWDFKDGTPPATGQKVTHTFAQAGTFVGELRVKDRAGNPSDPRQFSVTVNPRPGDAVAGAGTAGAVTPGQGNAAFKIDTIKVSAKYAKSRLNGRLTASGSSTQAGPLTAEVRLRGRRVARVGTTLAVGPFTATLKLPPTLLPGTYQLVFTGPGGSLNSSLTLVAPREGVLRSARVRGSRAAARATFTLASQPVKALRGKLAVVWSQGARPLGRVKVTSRGTIAAGPPKGATLRAGPVSAQLRAGTLVVGSASGRLR